MNTMVLGIAGGTGSGKTTLTKRLKERFGDQISVISHDNYYKRQDELTYEQRCLTNYDHPNAFETELMVEHIKALKAGETVLCPVYDFSQHNRSDDFIQIHPAPVILVEGILIFASPELCDLMDIKVFVDTDADVRILRRIVRDVKKRGRTLDSVVTQYLTTVKRPCTSSSWSPASAGPTSSSPRAARTRWRWRCSSTGWRAIWPAPQRSKRK